MNLKKKYKRKRKKKPRPIIRITADHIELASMAGVYGILVLEVVWFLISMVTEYGK